MTSIIGVIALKGGVSKTTTSIYLATHYAREGKTVELLDLDPQLSAYEWAQTAKAYGQEMEYETVPVTVGDVKDYRANADVLIIDTPPGNAKALEATEEIADILIIPTQPSPADISRVWRTLAALTHKDKARVLITRASLKTILFRESESAFESQSVPVLGSIIKERQSIKRAYGQRPSKDLSGYENVASEIQKTLGEK